MLQHDLPGAVRAYQRAVELDPDLVSAHLSLSSALQQRGGIEQALQERQEAVGRQPSSGLAHALLGHAWFLTGNVQNADEELRMALDLAPRLAIAHFYLSQCLRMQGDIDGAATAANTATKTSPNTSEFWSQLGVIRMEQGRLPDAIVALKESRWITEQRCVSRVSTCGGAKKGWKTGRG